MATTASDSPGFRVIYGGEVAYCVNGFIFFGLIATIVTLVYLLRENTTHRQKQLLLAAWVVIPPRWFLVEYYFLYLPRGSEGSFGFFQYGQTVASKVWAAVSALITASLFSDRDKHEANATEKKTETGR